MAKKKKKKKSKLRGYPKSYLGFGGIEAQQAYLITNLETEISKLRYENKLLLELYQSIEADNAKQINFHIQQVRQHVRPDRKRSRTYTVEFKLEMIKAIEAGGHGNAAAILRRYNVPAVTFAKWREDHRKDGAKGLLTHRQNKELGYLPNTNEAISAYDRIKRITEGKRRTFGTKYEEPPIESEVKRFLEDQVPETLTKKPSENDTVSEQELMTPDWEVSGLY